MARSLVCDSCGKKTERIVAKVFLLGTGNGKSWNASNYTAHADIGECCSEKLARGEIVKWRKRKKREKVK